MSARNSPACLVFQVPQNSLRAQSPHNLPLVCLCDHCSFVETLSLCARLHPPLSCSLRVSQPHSSIHPVSAAYPTLFTPAGYAFSIWGLIFAMEGAFALYQLLPSVRSTPAIQKGVGPWWILMVLLQLGWSLSFATESIPLSMFFMVGIFLSLLALTLSIRQALPRRPSLAQSICLLLPFSLNF